MNTELNLSIPDEVDGKSIILNEITMNNQSHSSTFTISFRNIEYRLNRSFLRRKSPQIILNKISGIFTTGMNAIMGKENL